MDPTKIIQLASQFHTVAGKVLDDLKRSDLATVDLDMLNLKRSVLAEGLEDFKRALAREADLEEKNQLADLAKRGLMGSSIQLSIKNGVFRNVADVTERVHREYNR